MTTAVVLMAYGSPSRIEDVPAYYADIRGGRPIKPEHLDDLVARYKRLGIEDSNPLNEITEATRSALEAELGLPVFTGMRHWTPRIAEAVEQALAGGATEIVGLVLAPHYSSLSIEKYRAQLGRRTRRAARSSASSSAGATSPASSTCSRSGLCLRNTSTSSSPPTRSRPGSSTRAIRTGTSCSRRRGSWPRRLGSTSWSFSFQSESPTGEPWLGPGHPRPPRRARRVRRPRTSSSCPVGFVADHLEIRWDLDVEAAEKAQELGLRLERIELPNADPAFIAVLAGLVRRAVAVPSAG